MSSLSDAERLQAYAFRKLMAHLQMRSDVQNIDQMNLAGFCRNCMAKWLFAGALELNVPRDYASCLSEVYGMEYSRWKALHQSKATPAQLEAYSAGKARHAQHPAAVNAAAKGAKSKKKPSSTETSDSKARNSRPQPSSKLSDVCCQPPGAAQAETRASSAAAAASLVVPVAYRGKTLPLRVGVLTVSDRVSKGVYEDKSGPLIQEVLRRFSRERGVDIRVTKHSVVPDEAEDISKTIRTWATRASPQTDASQRDEKGASAAKQQEQDGQPLDLILTTGGTGFSGRDVTPEATHAVLDRDASGLAHAVTLAAQSRQPMSVLSRATCGLVGRTIVYNLPGR